MQIEMVETILGPLPRVALDRREVVVADDDDRRTVQVNWHLIETNEIVRQDGHVEVKRWPEGMQIIPGSATVGG